MKNGVPDKGSDGQRDQECHESFIEFGILHQRHRQEADYAEEADQCHT